MSMFSSSQRRDVGRLSQEVDWNDVRQAYRCMDMTWSMGSMLWLRVVMMNRLPAISRKTIRTPNAKARTLLAPSGPVEIASSRMGDLWDVL